MDAPKKKKTHRTFNRVNFQEPTLKGKKIHIIAISNKSRQRKSIYVTKTFFLSKLAKYQYRIFNTTLKDTKRTNKKCLSTHVVLIIT